MSDLPKDIPFFLLDSNESTTLFITHYKKWVVYLPSLSSFEWAFFIIDRPQGEDLILGYDFLYHFNCIIDRENELITYDFGGITSFTSNNFATYVNSVAPVDDLKTPPLPSSVHTPPIIPAQ
ncbi:hypothetical protein O181_111007 [Austropuccinia psidii MF-1]|uniref:Uncharacterized protein n=1 Tax=Austropuccinia psidii MF-1 TaxID=1389203 RepID=A0A9Q3K0Y7_9BASI|nr:hypothetical protein [Austropuccinia psidii MF-1]